MITRMPDRGISLICPDRIRIYDPFVNVPDTSKRLRLKMYPHNKALAMVKLLPWRFEPPRKRPFHNNTSLFLLQIHRSQEDLRSFHADTRWQAQ